MLQGKVVVISGVGPALGTTLAVRCAGAGADVVLAARTATRLEEVAKEVVALGQRAVTVPTDITDQVSAENLVSTAVDAYGKVDVLINNAFSVPSMKPLARTDFDHIRGSFELTVLGALRLTQLFTPALAEAHGAVVNINSMVLRHSQERYGSYKMAKAALLAMSQSLSTELGPQGIRVNSVAPGYIWGDTLKQYFAHQAEKYGITVDQIYEHTAANTDLKRLPEGDEIADAVIFLASPMAAAITGQCLDVNCGEFHH
ncbi:short-chain dehydrogenase [Rhodococcus sp. WMMA185]|nr:short-chain dehydrogenase [Rhodococcus sp. WMMA185]